MLAAQTWFVWQRWPLPPPPPPPPKPAQPPQFAGSLVVSTHRTVPPLPPKPVQAVYGDAQAPVWQAEATQTPPVQGALQPPQAAESAWVSVVHVPKPPPQVAKPGRQVQAPLLQSWSRLQLWPHWPQFCGSFWVSVHAPLHEVSPPVHAHWPLVQIPLAQTVPQPPQFWGSVCVSVQVVPQRLWPVAHGATQVPEMQRSLAAHWVAQLPQCAGSVAGLVQALPQAIWLVPQAVTQLPPEQYGAVPLQACWQPPQFSGSDWVFTQVEPHWVSPTAQFEPQTPLRQTPLVQTLPQRPQLLGSLSGFVQAVPQSCCPWLQGFTHWPEVQVWFGPHWLPQLPQLAGSVAKFAQEPFGQVIWLPGHVATQLPPEQSGVAVGQAWPQPPQSAGLLSVFTQAVPQWVSPLAQAETQVPETQVVPAPQIVPQLPQLFGSVATLVQAPLQSDSFVGQAATQPPREQSGAAPLQAVPQFPQFAGSVWRFTQAPLQAVWPVAQLTAPVLPPLLDPPDELPPDEEALPPVLLPLEAPLEAPVDPLPLAPVEPLPLALVEPPEPLVPVLPVLPPFPAPAVPLEPALPAGVVGFEEQAENASAPAARTTLERVETFMGCLRELPRTCEVPAVYHATGWRQRAGVHRSLTPASKRPSR